MTIPPIRQDQAVKQHGGQVTLRNGQIIEGTITKLFPNDTAEIQIGSNKIVANVTTALSVGEKYFLQVQHTDQIVQLKVVSDPLKQNNQVNVADLLSRLGLKTTRENIALVSSFIERNIPFEKEQVIQAERLLQTASNKGQAIETISDMMQRKLPLNQHVFQALLAVKSSSMNDGLQQMLQQLQSAANNSNIERQLVAIIQQLMVHGTNQSALLSSYQMDELLPLLQLTNAVSLQMNATDLSAFIRQNKAMFNEPESVLNRAFLHMIQHEHSLQSAALRIASIFHPLQHGTLTTEQFSQLSHMIHEQLMPHLPEQSQALFTTLLQTNNGENQRHLFALLQMLSNEQTYTLAAQITNPLPRAQMDETVQQQLLSHIRNTLQMTGMLHEQTLKNYVNQPTIHYGTLLQHLLDYQTTLMANSETLISDWKHTLQTNEQLTSAQLALLTSQIQQQLAPFLANDHATLLMQGMANQSSDLLAMLQMFATESTYGEIEQFMQLHHMATMQRYIGEVSSILQTLHIPLEDVTGRQSMLPQTDSIKSLLIQMIQQGDSGHGERGQQLIHLINGLQIQSVQESGNLVHAQLQLPGEKIGLNEDLFMQFEGKKNENDEMDPDFCRILFVLHLHHLEETIIDMHVQKRTVSITVFNDNHMDEELSNYKQMLATGLKKLDYHLSTIQWKPLHEQPTKRSEDKRHVQPSPTEQTERYDFRI